MHDPEKKMSKFCNENRTRSDSIAQKRCKDVCSKCPVLRATADRVLQTAFTCNNFFFQTLNCYVSISQGIGPPTVCL